MCGECGHYEDCSKSCGEGRKEGYKECWVVNGVNEEVPGSRHSVSCTDRCFITCPVKECGDCGDYGPCSESCGAEGTQQTTRECWMNDGETGEEIPGNRYKEMCNKICFIPCSQTTTECKVYHSILLAFCILLRRCTM